MAIDPIPSLETKLATQQKKLLESPTAYVSGESPTRSDISKQLSAQATQTAIDAAKSKTISERWYGKGTRADAPAPPERKGFISRVGQTLTAPVHAVVGATQYALGQTDDENVIDAAWKNVSEREEGFGSVLARSGAPDYISMPLGFALDIALDPVNWATVGTSALVPRIGVGAAKAGLKGAALGAETGLADKVAWLIRPTARKSMMAGREAVAAAEAAGKEIPKIVPTLPERFLTRLGQKKGEYLEAIGKADPFAETAPTAYTQAVGSGLTKIREGIADTELGRKALTQLEYNPTRFSEAERAFEVSKPAVTANLADVADDIVEHGDPSIVKNAADFERRFQRPANPTIEKINSLAAKSPTVRRIYDAMNTLTGAFKIGKTAGSPGSFVSAIAGNVGFTAMGGITPRAGWISEIRKARKALRSEADIANFYDLMTSPGTHALGIGNPDKFYDLYGFRYSEIEPLLQGAKEKLVRAGLMGENEIASTAIGIAERAVKEGKMTANEFANFKNTLRTPIKSEVETALKTGVATGTGYAHEVAETPGIMNINKFMEKLAAKPGIAGWTAEKTKAAMDYLSKAYGDIDKTFKIGTFNHLTGNGITAEEVKKLRSFFGSAIGPNDLVYAGTELGERLYRISPAVASDIVEDMYMNYKAMPEMIRLFRGIPLLGSPFASFGYAALWKSAGTLAYNPSFYSKLKFLGEELSGQQSPVEKKLLEQQRFEYLRNIGYQRLGGIPILGRLLRDYPVWLNLASMLPFLSPIFVGDNMREFQGTAPGDWALAAIDKQPFVGKDPLAQVIFNYMIQPALLSEQFQPVGFANQPLYPKDATIGEKVAYGLRDVAEAYTPNILAPLGIPLAALSENAVSAFPLYRGRQMGMAALGKSEKGVQKTSEPVATQLLKSLGGYAGVPFQSVDLTKLSKSIRDSGIRIE